MADDFDPDKAQERLDELGEDIAKARKAAEEDILPEGDPDERTYAESGAEGRDEDDQTITPPG